MQIQPDPFKSLKDYILVDGFDMILDLERSEGSWLYDSKSNSKYLDFFSFFASAPVGFNHPDAVNDPDFQKSLSMAGLNKVSNSDFYTNEYIKFVETFARVAIPSEFKHAFFVSGGALGVENSLKAAFDWKVRSNFDQGMEKELGGQVLHFKEAFHGRTGYTMSLTNTADPRKYMYYPRFDWPRISNPKITFPLDENLQQIENAELKSVTEIEQAFEDNKNDIATIIIEPIQGEGGDNHFRPEFFKELRRLANEHEAMLIFDEVQTGIGMTGKMWAYSHYGVTPDMITFGKKMQTCGFLSTDRIDSVENNVFEESSRINTTWGGNLVDFVRSTKYLEIIENHQLVEKTRQNGEYMLNYLRGVADESRGLISNVRGKGLFIAFDLPSSETRDKIKTEMYKENVIVLNTGKQSIRFRPPLTITTDEIDWGMEKLMDIIKNIDSKY